MAGSIEAAIVIEYGKNGDHFDYYEMFYEGLNGQLPNLDLLNTANLIGSHENLKPSLQHTSHHELDANTYYTRLRTLVKGIFSLTLSGLSSNTPGCEAFSGWQIQSFTIKAKGSSGPADITQFGRVIDSTFRSVNNLLEKFHQSFFFYLMLSPQHFVSIGTYLPSSVLLAVSFVFSSLGCILNSGVKAGDFVSNSSTILTVWFTIEVIGFVLGALLPFLTKTTPKEFEAITVLQILYGLTGLNFLLSGLPLVDIKSKYKINKAVKFGLISLSLFFIAMLILTLLIVHFSLALAIGTLAIPLTFVQPLMASALEEKVKNEIESEKVKESNQKSDPLSKLLGYVKNNKAQIKISLCLFVSNPFFVIFIAGSFLDPENGAVSLMRGLLTSWHELQCWTWFVVILGWFPAWMGVAVAVVFGEYDVDYTKVINKIKSE